MNIENHPRVYEASDDSFLLLKNIKVKKGENVLDMGMGSGIIGIHLAKLGANVTCADINPCAVELSKKNAGLNNVKINVVQSNLFEKIKNRFDVIVFNPPYLPTSKNERVDDEINSAWDGGEEGDKVILGFLKNFKKYLKKNGRCYLLVSSLNKKALKKIEELDGGLIGEKKLFFESLKVFQL
jgi:release factor glutamine methyltransferase